MKDKKVKKVRSSAPIYIVAGFWLLYGLCFPLYTGRQILLAAILSAAIWFICLPFFPKREVSVQTPASEPKKREKPVSTGNPEVDEMIRRGREAIAKLESLNNDIRDEYVSLEISRMERACRTIFDTIAEKPDRADDVRRFLNYYLPTSIKLLESYRKLSMQEIAGENIRATLDSIKNNMDMVANAFEKQADNLFADEALDITTDIDVLETMMRSEGLKKDEKAL